MLRVDAPTQPTEHAPVARAACLLGHLERLQKLRGYAEQRIAPSHQGIMHKHVNQILLKMLQTIILLLEEIKQVAMSLALHASDMHHQQPMEKTPETRSSLEMDQLKTELEYFLPLEQTLETQLPAQEDAQTIKQTTTQLTITLSLVEIMQVAETSRLSIAADLAIHMLAHAQLTPAPQCLVAPTRAEILPVDLPTRSAHHVEQLGLSQLLPAPARRLEGIQMLAAHAFQQAALTVMTHACQQFQPISTGIT